jgi:hypothetical protein
MRVLRLCLAVACLLVCGWPSIAADTRPPANPRPPGQVVHVPPEEAFAILGLPVTGPDGKTVGRLVDLLVDASGKPEAGVIDVGGFMGVGARKIAVHWSTLHFAPADPKRPITLDLTLDQIKAAPEFGNSSKPAPVVVPAKTPGATRKVPSGSGGTSGATTGTGSASGGTTGGNATGGGTASSGTTGGTTTGSGTTGGAATDSGTTGGTATGGATTGSGTTAGTATGGATTGSGTTGGTATGGTTTGSGTTGGTATGSGTTGGTATGGTTTGSSTTGGTATGSTTTGGTTTGGASTGGNTTGSGTTGSEPARETPPPRPQ